MKADITSTIKDPVEQGRQILEEHIARKSMEWEAGVKEIVHNAGHTDTGDLINSFYTETHATGFTGISSAKHAVYFEYGTEPHWVPFYNKQGEPVLADWGRRVLKLTKEEMLKMGGIVVELDEIAMMRRSLAKLQAY